MPVSRNYYKILGVNPKASADEIKKAYRKLAHQYHPDKNKAGKAGEENFRLIKEAYEVLSDPRKKAEFDFILKQPAVSPYAFSREIKGFQKTMQTSHVHPAPIIPDNEKAGKSFIPAWLTPIILILIALICVQIIMITSGNEKKSGSKNNDLDTLNNKELINDSDKIKSENKLKEKILKPGDLQ